MAPQNSVFGGERGQRQSSSFWPPGASGMDVVGWSAHLSPIFANSAPNPSHASSESYHPCFGIQHALGFKMLFGGLAPKRSSVYILMSSYF